MTRPDLLSRRRKHFVLWRPRVTDPTPRLVIGTFAAGNPATLAGESVWDLAPEPNLPGVWSRPAADCGLVDGRVYHYWFEVTDSRPDGPGARIRRTDPAAGSTNWSLLSHRCRRRTPVRTAGRPG